MANEDILLSIGIDLSSLKQAQAQVAQAVKGWDIPQPQVFGKGESGLVDQYGKALKSVTTEVKATGTAMKEVNAESGTFTKLLERISLWSIGWTVAYNTLRGITVETKNLAASIVNLNATMQRSRVIAGELADTYDHKWNKVQKDLFARTKAGLLSLNEMTNAFALLQREGLSPELAANATMFVRQLSTITGTKPEKSAEVLAEFYGLLGNSMQGTASETEKLQIITSRLVDVYLKGNIPITEFKDAISRISLTSQNASADLDYLTRAFIFLDGKMISGRLAASAMQSIFSEVTESTHELNKALGTRINPRAGIVAALQEIKSSLEGLSSAEKQDILGKVFDKQTLQIVTQLLKESDLALKNIALSSPDAVRKIEEVTTFAHALSVEFGMWRKNLAEFFSMVGESSVGKFLGGLWQYTIPGSFVKYVNNEQKKRLEKEQTDMIKRGQGFDQGAFNSRLETSRQATPAVKLEKQNALTRESIKYVANLKEAQQIELMSASGIDKRIIAQQEINNLISSTVREQNTAAGKIEVSDAMRKAVTQDLASAYQTLRNAGLGDLTVQEKITELARIRLDITKENAAEVLKLADDLQGKTTDLVKGFMQGKGDVKSFVAGVTSSIQSNFSENLVKSFGEKTGIFTSMSSTIIKAHIDGIKQGFGAVQTGGAAPTGSPVSGLIATAKGLFSSGDKSQIKKLTDSISQQGSNVDLGTIEVKKQTTELSKLSKLMSAMGQAAGIGATVYSGYQGVLASRQQGGVSGAIGGGLSGAMAGAQFGGWGAFLGFLGGAIYGSKKDKNEPARDETLNTIASRISISNKELQIINRNLTGLRSVFEGYVMPKSKYFSNSAPENVFAVDKVSGYRG